MPFEELVLPPSEIENVCLLTGPDREFQCKGGEAAPDLGMLL